jgi:hypothetical protein
LKRKAVNLDAEGDALNLPAFYFNNILPFIRFDHLVAFLYSILAKSREPRLSANLLFDTMTG